MVQSVVVHKIMSQPDTNFREPLEGRKCKPSPRELSPKTEKEAGMAYQDKDTCSCGAEVLVQCLAANAASSVRGTAGCGQLEGNTRASVL